MDFFKERMISMKKIVSIQDISCFGKCSLTVALPIISAMGIETAVIPTAVLSTHTGSGFENYTFRDLTGDIPAIADHWKSMNLKFDGIYTGYLGSIEQVAIVSDFFDRFSTKDNFILVDPVLGDAGRLYTGFTNEFVAEMRKLCSKADYILPMVNGEIDGYYKINKLTVKDGKMCLHLGQFFSLGPDWVNIYPNMEHGELISYSQMLQLYQNNT